MAKQADSSEVFHFLNRDLIFWGLLIAGLMIPGGVWVLQMGEPLQFAVCCWGIGVGSLVMTARLERELVIDGRQLVTTRWCWRSGAIALNDVVSVEHGYDVTQGDVAKRFKRVCLVLADGKKIELNGVREGTDALYAALRRACEEARAMDTVKAEEEALKSHRGEFRGSMTLERVLSYALSAVVIWRNLSLGDGVNGGVRLIPESAGRRGGFAAVVGVLDRLGFLPRLGLRNLRGCGALGMVFEGSVESVDGFWCVVDARGFAGQVAFLLPRWCGFVVRRTSGIGLLYASDFDKIRVKFVLEHR